MTRRSITIGGLSKSELLGKLNDAGVKLNEAAHILFQSDLFVTLPASRSLSVVELSVHELGFEQGATAPQIHTRASELGLQLCPLETGPHLRLQYLDQPEGSRGFAVTKHRAPPGSIGIASPAPSSDETFPKGFYLRCIEGIPWLRGYWSGPDHLYDPEDHFLFAEE